MNATNSGSATGSRLKPLRLGDSPSVSSDRTPGSTAGANWIVALGIHLGRPSRNSTVPTTSKGLRV